MFIINNEIKLTVHQVKDEAISDVLYNTFTEHNKLITITWCYDDMSELFYLSSIVGYYKLQGVKVHLVLTYVPDASQDITLANRMPFLETFCTCINNINVDKISVIEPYCDTVVALLNNAEALYINYFSIAPDMEGRILLFLNDRIEKKFLRVSQNLSYAVHGKLLLDENGKPIVYELINFIPGTKDVFIITDICAIDPELFYAISALKEKLVEHVYIVTAHCMPEIFKSNLFDYIDGIFTTDSILDFTNNNYDGFTPDKSSKMYISKLFRTTEPPASEQLTEN